MEPPASVSVTDLRIQFMSDLHIEMGPLEPLPPIPVLAPILALLGDIGYPESPAYGKFLEDQSARFELVLVLMGNHEYYKSSIEAVSAKLVELAARLPKVRFMCKTSFMLRGVRVLGTTLWSNVPAIAAAHVGKYMNDYRYIKIGPPQPPDQQPRLLTVADTNTFHQDERQWLEKELKAAKERNEKVLVLTHYAPSMTKTSHPRFASNEGGSNHGFSTPLEHLMGKPVCAWLYGHTHFNNHQKIDGYTYLTSNQAGYNKGERIGFDPTRVLEINHKKHKLPKVKPPRQEKTEKK